MVPIFNAHIAEVISKPTSEMDESTAYPRTELDSHANMIVLGHNSFVFESTGRTCNVQPFSTDLGTATNISIVDGAIAYDCPYSLSKRNILYSKPVFVQKYIVQHAAPKQNIFYVPKSSWSTKNNITCMKS